MTQHKASSSSGEALVVSPNADIDMDANMNATMVINVVDNTVDNTVTDTVTNTVTDTVTNTVTDTVTNTVTDTVTNTVTDTVTNTVTDSSMDLLAVAVEVVDSASKKKKRKEPHEYSTNPNTIRVRERIASLTPYRLAVERAKSNDLKAVSSAWKERAATETYKAASEADKKKIIEEVEHEVMERRRRKGIDASTKIAALNQRLDPNGDNTPGQHATDTAASATKTVNKSTPQMAPPGYIPYPTQTIDKLMEIPKRGTVLPETEQLPGHVSGFPAGSGSSAGSAVALGSRAHDSDDAANLSASITRLCEQYCEERKRHAESEEKLKGEIRKLQELLETMRGQIREMGSLIQSGHSPQASSPVAQICIRGLPVTRHPNYGYHIGHHDDHHDHHAENTTSSTTVVPNNNTSNDGSNTNNGHAAGASGAWPREFWF